MRTPWTVALVLLAAAPAARAQIVTERARLQAPGGVDLIGAVVLAGDTAVAQGPGPSTGNTSLHVFRLQGAAWTHEAQVDGNQVAIHDNFGSTFDLDADTLVVGAPGDGGTQDSGSVYVFVRSGTTWSQQARLTAGDAGAGTRLGSAVAVEGDVLVAGARTHVHAGTLTGAVYVFRRTGTTWTEEIELRLAAPGTHLLGYDVDLDGGRVVATERGGGATFFVPSTVLPFWMEGATVVPGLTIGSTDELSVALRGDELLLGAPFADAAFHYTFDGATWGAEERIDRPIDRPISDRFGRDVALGDGVRLVGADEATFPDQGEAWFYRSSTAGACDRVRLLPSSPQDGQHLGRSVAFEAPWIACASADGLYVYLTTDTDLRPQTYCTAKTGSTGCVPFVATTGVASVSATTPFLVEGRDVVPGEAGLLLYGVKKANLDFHGGKLCLKAPAQRLLPPRAAKAGGTPPCSGVLRRDLNPRIQSGADPRLTAGQRIHAQWLQRDPGDPTGFGDLLTDAVTFTICL